MCSIFGAFGPKEEIDLEILNRLKIQAGDRGRDGGRVEKFELGSHEAYLGNWRATPTTELERGKLQPYDGLVHNGTVANDKELGGTDSEIDSEVLARVVGRTSLSHLVASLRGVVGSYALGVVSRQTQSVFLACNYKPVYFYNPDGEGRVIYFSSMERHFRGIVPVGQRPDKLLPYSAIDLKTGETARIERNYKLRALVICSSGLDSTTVAYKLKDEGFEVGLIHFQYGCLAENRETEAVKLIAKDLGSKAFFAEIPYTQMAGSAPIMNNDNLNVVESIKGAEYAHEWVPARNLVMLAHATAFAEANDYHVIALGNNLEEAGAYPDNEEEFTNLFDNLLDYAVQNGYEVRVVSPVGHLMKHEIVKLGLELKVPYELTWSCYRGGETHCGHCGPCFMRKTAFERNGMVDPVMPKLEFNLLTV
jgi:7-cyano-7-deazaguanine synthase